MPPPITSKSQMYRLLAAGAFGNTIPQWLDAARWDAEAPTTIRWWGVRTMTPGGPCSLNCPDHAVRKTFAAFQAAGHVPQISMMVDRVANVMAWLEVWESPTGLVVEGIEYPDTSTGMTWRDAMPDPALRRRWEGTAARLVLARHLNENDRDDLAATLERFPGHVVEMSALDRCIGTVPHRRAVVWEVRAY
jgi:hypothetical protein